MRLFMDMLYHLFNREPLQGSIYEMKRLYLFPAIFCMLLMYFSAPVHAAASSASFIPPPLAPWESWVMYGHEDYLCPRPYNDATVHQCVWPSRLNLEINPMKGRFSQQWLVFKTCYVPLPGSRALWPQEVKEGTQSFPVIERHGMPVIRLTPGEHSITGHYSWHRIPEMIPVPPACGLITLTLSGKPIAPVVDNQGRLWVQKKPKGLTLEDKLDIEAFRLVEDTIPLRVITLLKLNISGNPREIMIKGALLNHAVPLKIESPLPARLDSNGHLQIQARPGQWSLHVISFLRGHILSLQPAPFIGRQEIWCFKPHRDIRMVKIEGVPSIDPRQTGLPPEWKRYTAFLVTPESRITLKELRRGDPLPAPDQLNLRRIFWLDFNGEGFTIQDHITGTVRRSWRLEINPPIQLGHVAIDGKDQLITHLGKKGKKGVELRKGILNMTAESRIKNLDTPLPAVGWNHDFQSVHGVFNLPPGWRLLTMSGPDIITGTWFEKWTLLDLFLVLIITMIVGRLFGIRWAFLAFATLVLTYHEKGAPQIAWLSLLVPTALLQFLPNSWVKNLIKLWRLGAIIALIVIAIPFMVHQVRIGFYPQLERITFRHGVTAIPQATRNVKRRRGYMEKSVTDRTFSRKTMLYSYGRSNQIQRQKLLDIKEQKAVLMYDPNARIQTGPGIPSWRWRQIPLKWNGPVDKAQTLRFYLLPPRVNFFLSLLRVLLLAWLIYLCAGFMNARKNRSLKGFLIGILFVTCLISFPTSVVKASPFPPDSMLNELQKRLLTPPECFPTCATIPKMNLKITQDNLRILLEIHTAVDVAVPLPGNLRVWQPTQIFLDEKPAKGLSRDKSGHLWLFCPSGIHRVVLNGSASHLRSLPLPFILLPHMSIISAQGWQVQGINEAGQILSTLRFVREETTESTRQHPRPQIEILPFSHVTRTLLLGLQWEIQTTVERLTPVGTSFVIQVPLIKDESVTTEGLDVRNGKVTLSFKADTRRLQWRSHLDQTGHLTLKAPEKVPWTETWVLDTSPIWHCKFSGIPVVHHQDERGYWQPTWKPWPGETVSIRVTHPGAVAGEILTIHRVKLQLDRGKRFDRIHLSLDAKASQGQQHIVKLPSGAKLLKVAIDGRSQPIPSRKGILTLPLHPGKQNLQITWLQPNSSAFITRLPKVDIGHKAVNATIIYKIPAKRWVLWTHGPTLGPAVLFWSYLLVILLIAVGLGKIPWTPLRPRHWILLGLGLTQVNPFISLIIVGWILALGIRKKEPPIDGAFRFDVTQLILVGWTAAALIGLYVAITKGLLGIPDMQISGNGSSHVWLRWFQDRTDAILPQPSVLSIPLLIYRGLMLLWALWLAYSLILWLRWGWQCFNEGGGWKRLRLRSNRKSKKGGASLSEGNSG